MFLTNQTTLPALTICALYKSRWQVEPFFKWIKQHLRIKRFYGTSENAVKSQIRIAVSVYVLVAIIKKRLTFDASLYTLRQKQDQRQQQNWGSAVPLRVKGHPLKLGLTS